MKMIHNHYADMFFIMIISGLLSTMNIWVDKWSDIRFSMNDMYMILLMTGWMFLFMGILYKEFRILVMGLSIVVVMIGCIRTQFLISESQYKMGMIPHHSMAIHMSRKLLEKGNISISSFLKNIIKTQENEIILMKQ